MIRAGDASSPRTITGWRLLLIVRKSSHHLLMECFLWHGNVVRALDTIEDIEVLCL